MDAFLNLHRESVVGTISTFDRMIFKGHLTGLWPKRAFEVFLSYQGVLLKDFGAYVQMVSDEVKAHAQALAAKGGRPFTYLQGATTKRAGQSKEELARSIAECDGITEGLVCVFSVLEPCRSFAIQSNREMRRLEVVQRQRKCLHFYFYFMDREFGLMHVRLQSWFPFSIQVYVNGRAWLARQFDREGIAYERHENAFTRVGDLSRATKLCERFAHRRWPRVLDTLARRLNPVLPLITDLGFGGYYWVLDQAEYATDIMFRSRQSLAAVYPDLIGHAGRAFTAEDVLRFLGRKLHGNFQGEVTTDVKRRPEGWRIKHRMKRNSIKMYDKACVLRIETTINNPREFKVLRVTTTRHGRSRRWCPMGKGVANIWRYAEVSRQSNYRYLDALAHVQPKGKSILELDRLCRSRTIQGKRYSRFNPITRDDCTLFQAVMAGEHTINGFRNRDLQTHLYSARARNAGERRRRSARTSRVIRKLRGHRLVAKVPGCRLYRVTDYGYQIMSAAIYCRTGAFADAMRTITLQDSRRAE
jgi:hypothetical protein